MGRNDPPKGKLVSVHSAGRDVVMLEEVHAEFQKLDKRWKKKFETHFKHYGIAGTTLPKEHFNSEGRHPTGGAQSRDERVCAFKAFQHRLYGVVTGFGGKETFVGMKLVPDKKRQKADQDLLRRVAKDFGEIFPA